MSELSTSVYSETVDTSRAITLLSYQIHTYNIYIQTGCGGKIIKKTTYFQTRWDTVALLTLYENLVF